MNKKTPLIAVSALAVVAAATFGIVSRNEAPAPKAPEAVVETPAKPEAQVAIAAPETPVVAAPKPAELVPAAPEVILPSFDTVRVEPAGDAVIAGHAAPGAEVTVKFAGAVVGTATAGPDGSFVLVPEKPLPAGAGALTLETQADGKTLNSTDAVAIAVTGQKPALVAKVDGTGPVKVVQAPATAEAIASVTMRAIDYDDLGNMVFQGQAKPGTRVRLYVDNAFTGETASDASGTWTFKGDDTIAPGQHALRVDAVDGEGKVTSRAETPFLREKPEKVIAALEAKKPAVEAPAETEVAAAPEVKAEGETAAAPETAIPETEVAISETPSVVEAVQDPSGPMRIVIQPGNNLWRISRQVYGKGRMYTIIFEANRDLVKDPSKVYPGQILTAPAKSP